MAQQAPVNPTIPQDDPAGAAARKAYLETMQQQYEWTDAVPSLPGVPAVKNLPDSEQPSLEWWLMLVGVLLQIHRNDTAAEEALAAKGLASLDPLVLDADKAFVGAVEKLVTSLEQKIAGTTVTKKNIGTVVGEFLEVEAA
jgi:arachidonate 15-lipoxygenase